MAEIQASSSGNGGEKARSKKLSTKVDFTAMVDLAFLLITFFMLTTSLTKPNIMPIVMPETDLPANQLPPEKESHVLTLLLGANDKVYHYEGITNAKLDSTDYSSGGIRQVILGKKDRLKAMYGEEEKEDTKKPGQKK